MLQKIKDHIIPHTGNGYMPHLLQVEAIVVVLLFVGVLQFAFITHTAIIHKSDFFSAVLPAVLVSATNTDRVQAGVLPLEADPLLSIAAQLKAQDMANRGYFAHQDPDGRQPWYWFDIVGYDYSYAGENLAVNFTESADVNKAWMESPEHYKNIVKEKFTHIGIGVAQGMYKGKETVFAVQFFATKPQQIVASTLSVVKEDIVVEKEATDRGSVQDIPQTENENSVQTSSAAKQALSEVPQDVIVLGIETQSKEQVEYGGVARIQEHELGVMAQLLTSPSTIFIPILIIVFIGLALMFSVSLLLHMSTARYAEGMVAAVLALLIVSSVIYFDESNSHRVTLPTDVQYANVGTLFK